MADEILTPSPAPAAPEPSAPPEAAPSGVPIYDISGKEPVFGHIDPTEVTQSVASGRFSLPKGQPVPVMSPDGQAGHIDPEEAPEAFKNGYSYNHPVSAEVAAAQGPGGTLGALIEGAGQGILGPIAPALETALDIKREGIRAREEAHPVAHAVGEGAGFLGSLLSGTGEAALVGKIGEAAELGANGLIRRAALGADVAGPLSRKASFLNDVAGGSVRGATEMALLQSGDNISKMIESDPGTASDTAIANVGLSAALGAGVGGGLGVVSPLFKAALGSRLAQHIDDFGGRMRELLENPDTASSVNKEAQDLYSGVTSMADEVYGANGLKAKDIAAAMPEMHVGITEQAQEIADKASKQIKKMVADTNSYPPRLTMRLQGDLDKYLEVATKPDATAGDLFNAAQDLKQKAQEYSKFDKFVKPVDEAYDFVKDSKNLAHELRTSLEDKSVWGKAAERQQSINKAFVEFKPHLEDFERKFTSEVGGERKVDPGKINTYLNQLGKPNAELKQEMLQNFLDASDKYRKVISDTHTNLGIENPFPAASTQALRSTLGEKTPGAKLAEFLIAKGINNLAGEGLGAGVGGLLGHVTGLGEGFGAILGEKALAPFLKSVMPSLAKPLMAVANKASAFKAAAEYGMNVVKGDNLMGKAARNIFKAGEVLPQSMMPNERHREKLSEQLKKHTDTVAQGDVPHIGGEIGHYLPDHASAIGQTAANAAVFLSHLKPSTEPSAPMDPKKVLNSVQKANYNNALDIAQSPLIVADRIKKGTLTAQDVVALKSMYPKLYSSLASKITSEMTEAVSKGETIPYKTKMSLSLFLGQPLDSTLTPMSIMAAQSVQGPVPAQDQSGPTKKGTAKLGKASEAFKTPMQAAEADKAMKA